MATRLDRQGASSVPNQKHIYRGYKQDLPGPLGFIGAGKVGTALAALLHARGADIAAVAGRTPQSSRTMALGAGLSASVARPRADVLQSASIIFLTVPDDAIEPLCDEIAREGGWRPGVGVVHCSGALPSTILHSAREAGALIASCHPLQAFANLHAALDNMPGSTFALEGDPALVAQLERLVDALGGSPLHLLTENKILYHAAAVVASNYMVTLAALASDLLVRAGVAPNANTALPHLLPLMHGTLDNLKTLGLPDALTGPIARGDAGTVARHLQALSECAPLTADLYRHLALLTLPMAEAKSHFDEATTEKLHDVLYVETQRRKVRKGGAKDRG
ncbi:MAG TPA: DUF2520 domain-containing protein [Chloroflexia bacterium]|nr:DUF2520 domain-containing protein [Chloroflexia bacterium]